MKLKQFAFLTVVLSMVPVVFYNFFPGKIALPQIICSFPLIFTSLLFFSRNKVILEASSWIKYYLIYGVVMLVRGLLYAKSQNDWNLLILDGIPLFLFLQFTIYFGATNESLFAAMKAFIWFGLPMSLLIFYRFSPVENGFFNFGHFVSPITIFILLLPYFNTRVKLFVIFVAVVTLLNDINDRSTAINILVSFLISLTYYLRQSLVTLNIIKFLRFIFIFLPVLLLTLGLAGVFNIFEASSIYGEDLVVTSSDNKNSQELLVDSRTSIYNDVFTQLVKDDMVLFGLGADGKTQTSLTDIQNADFDLVYKDGRSGTESGMLNYFQYGGLAGALLYFMLFYKGSYLVIYKSNNWFCVMLGLWISYKLLYSFIEDILFFSTYSIFILLALGMCFNIALKKMSNEEIRVFFSEIFIFDKKKKDFKHATFKNYS